MVLARSSRIECQSLWRTSSSVLIFPHPRIIPMGAILPMFCQGRRNLHVSYVSYKTVPFNLSDIGEGITEVTVKEWFVKVGDKVAQFDNICEVQSDKASVTITSRYDGIITKLHYDLDAIARVGHPLVDIEAEGEEFDSSKATEQAEKSEDLIEINDRRKALATPAVRRIAAEYKVDLSLVPSSGKGGRVMKEDILAYMSGVAVQQTSTASQFPRTTPHISSAERKVEEDRVETIGGYSKVMVKTMTLANAVPHLVYSDEVNVGPLVELRMNIKQIAEKHKLKLTFMPFFLKAVSIALSEFPILNASVNEDCTQVTFKSRHNIGMAMDTPVGLVVPNVKDVQNLRILDIAFEINRIIDAGQKSGLAPSDVTGGTFSISNIGAIGGTYMKPVLLVPEVGIGALGRFQKLPRFNEKGELQEESVMCVSWAADHRVIDGATIARFSNVFKELIENPVQLLVM